MKKRTENLIYIVIFQTGIILAFLGVLILQGMRTDSKAGRYMNHNTGGLVLMDTRTGEEIALPIGRDDVSASVNPYEVCLKNREGRILYWGEYDSARGILAGELLLSEDELSSFAIVNRQDYSQYTISANIVSMETGDYYITLHTGKTEAESGKISSFCLNIFYAPI